jgi:hypothetical protein
MRIATSTILFKNYNYGAFLQAYALQQVIRMLGYNSEVINYARNRQSFKQSLLRKNPLIKYIKTPLIIAKRITMFILEKLYYGKLQKRYASSFEAFAGKFITVSHVLYSRDNAEAMGKAYDKVIVGSDQVWHPYNIKYKSHTLDFTESRPQKFSYAASFGYDEVEESSIPFIKKLADFDVLTVREPSGVQIIKRYTGREDVTVVLDPTLLLDKAKWENLAKQSDYPLPEHYVFVYAINNAKDEIINFAKTLGDKCRGKIILIPRGVTVRELFRYGGTNCGVNPADWVKLLLNADYVVTDSFHGTAFSVNLEKQFYVYCNSQAGRITNILDMCGLQNRRIDGGKVTNDVIDYTRVRKILDKERERCSGILREMLERTL